MAQKITGKGGRGRERVEERERKIRGEGEAESKGSTQKYLQRSGGEGNGAKPNKFEECEACDRQGRYPTKHSTLAAIDL